MVTAPAMYGDLMLQASLGIHQGVAYMQNLPLERREDAERAIADFRDVLHALREHTWVLLECNRVPGIIASPTPDPRERAAIRLADAIHDAVGSRSAFAWAAGTLSISPWGRAARSVRVAGELLATHVDATGTPRTPDVDAVLHQPAARQAGLAQVGDLAATLLSSANRLGLRAAQAGLSWSEVRAQVPDLALPHAYARDLAGAGSLPHWAALDDLTPASTPVRTDEPAAEFGDRMLRLRKAAWQLARSPHPSVDTLKTYATLGVAVHAHALASHGAAPSALPNGRHDTAGVVTTGRAWQSLSRALFDLHSAQPVDPQVVRDLHAVSRLLRTFAPLRGEQPLLRDTDRRHLRQAVGAALRMVSDIATWNQQTLVRMGAAGHLYVPARSLTGDQVTDALDLVAAKLTARLAPAPEHVIKTTSHRYEPLMPPDNSAITGAGGLILRAAPMEALARQDLGPSR